MADSSPIEVHPRPQEDSPPPQEVPPRPEEDNPRPEEDNPRPQKIPKLDKPGEESKKTTPYARLRVGDPETNEFMQQFLLFHYDFYRTEGFGIVWDKFDFFFQECKPCDGAPRLDWEQTNEKFAEQMALRAIEKYNKENGTNIVFVEHIEANFSNTSFLNLWITFRAKDMSSPFSEPKIYQAHTQVCGDRFYVPIFRVKPTDKEMAENPIRVNPPYPYHIDCDKPPVVFSFAGTGVDPVHGTPYTFNRHLPPAEDNNTEADIET